MKKRGPIGWLAHDVTHRGATAWALALSILLFYVVLYWGDDAHNINPLDKVAWALHLGRHGQSGAKWTLYGALYTAAVTLGGLHHVLPQLADLATRMHIGHADSAAFTPRTGHTQRSQRQHLHTQILQRLILRKALNRPSDHCSLRQPQQRRQYQPCAARLWCTAGG